MKIRLFTAPLAAMLLAAPLTYSQEQTKEPARQTDAATAEAQRQGTVALKPNAQSPTQSMSQAIAFEKFKEMAAEREARKAGHSTSADRSVETPKPKAEKK